MQLRQVQNDIPVDLQMSFFRYAFRTHHICQISIPFFQRRPFLLRIAQNDVLAYPVYVTAVGTEQILHLLPVWGVLLFFLSLICVLALAALLLRRWFRQDQQARWGPRHLSHQQGRQVR